MLYDRRNSPPVHISCIEHYPRGPYHTGDISVCSGQSTVLLPVYIVSCSRLVGLYIVLLYSQPPSSCAVAEDQLETQTESKKAMLKNAVILKHASLCRQPNQS
jgi:hypothetical protein